MLVYLSVGTSIGVFCTSVVLVIINLVIKNRNNKVKFGPKEKNLTCLKSDSENLCKDKIEINLVNHVSITSKDIIDIVRYNAGIDITERPLFKSPVTLKHKDMAFAKLFVQSLITLKYKDAAFAILYKTKKGIVIILRLADFYGHVLLNKNCDVYRVDFTEESDWYYIPVDDTLYDKQLINSILSAAYLYVKDEKDYRLETRKNGSCIRAD
ncbi:MAG: hypothetical protein FWG51_00270 [Firmicutes bacterium]|nr:hypothetical protein [Bacillota bacterium]